MGVLFSEDWCCLLADESFVLTVSTMLITATLINKMSLRLIFRSDSHPLTAYR